MEFYRMFNKNFLDKDIIENIKNELDFNFSLDKFKPENLISKNRNLGYVLTKHKTMM